MVVLTTCCKAAVITKHDREFPLGGNTWGIDTVCPACESCGEEHPETFEACDICGESPYVAVTIKGDLCERCKNEELEKLMKLVKFG